MHFAALCAVLLPLLQASATPLDIQQFVLPLEFYPENDRNAYPKEGKHFKLPDEFYPESDRDALPARRFFTAPHRTPLPPPVYFFVPYGLYLTDPAYFDSIANHLIARFGRNRIYAALLYKKRQ